MCWRGRNDASDHLYRRRTSFHAAKQSYHAAILASARRRPFPASAMQGLRIAAFPAGSNLPKLPRRRSKMDRGLWQRDPLCADNRSCRPTAVDARWPLCPGYCGFGRRRSPDCRMARRSGDPFRYSRRTYRFALQQWLPVRRPLSSVQVSSHRPKPVPGLFP